MSGRDPVRGDGVQRTIFDDVHEVARLWRDARVARIHGGTTEIMKEIIGRSLGLG
jgi:alkylation response protein AidB-like acyl-CoA dehydrogenase